MILQPAQPSDAYELHLRYEDSLEVSDGWRFQVRKAIVSGGAFSGRDLEGNLIGIGGVFATPDALVPWLLCSRHVAQHKASVWRFAKRAVAAMRRSGKTVANYIPLGSPNSDFVRRLGFVIDPNSDRPGWGLFQLPHV
jgi:hypothetical protein